MPQMNTGHDDQNISAPAIIDQPTPQPDTHDTDEATTHSHDMDYGSNDVVSTPSVNDDHQRQKPVLQPLRRSTRVRRPRRDLSPTLTGKTHGYSTR